MTRKRRTRQHIIADLGVNHVERYALRCGFTVEVVTHDDGVDMAILTYDGNGGIENGGILVQVKATDTPRILSDQALTAVSVDRSDLELWLDEADPVIFVLNDAQ